MFSYILRRLLYMIPIVIGVMLITFVLFNIMMSPDAMASRHLGIKASKQARENWLHNRGFDKAVFVDLSGTAPGSAYEHTTAKIAGVVGWFFGPIPAENFQERVRLFAFPSSAAGRGANRFDTQFFHSLKSFALFDLGVSDATGEPVLDMFKRGAVPSLMITLPAFVLGFFLSLGLSLFFVFVRDSRIDVWGAVACVGLMSLSIMVYAIGSQWLLASQFMYFPAFGFHLEWFSTARFVAIPIIAMVIGGLGSEVRLYRAIFLEEVRADYVRTAQAKGASAVRVLFVHVLKNGMISLITLVVASLPFLIMGSVVIESFFGIPGIGSFARNAIPTADFALLRADVYVGSLLYLSGLLLTDICYAIADPRIRLS